MIERLIRDGTAVARSDGTRHRIFPVAVYAVEGEALREWVLREGATRTIGDRPRLRYLGALRL